ncbi:hypothetical protein [Frankia sp. AiPa1]|uniref:hypothetical protein n=1 Tax=Frankia sp. AiPa1 TaxID=573492 RepID=UPI00202B18BB|nr:hypothetical protein [Frankia sp. AiPa1]
MDGANVIGAGADGWWRDRPGAARRLIAAISAWIDESGVQRASPESVRPPERIVVVLEGAARSGYPAGPVANGPGGKAVTGDFAGSSLRADPVSARGLWTGSAERPALEIVHAPGHGDDAIVAAAHDAGPGTLVITSDRALAGRVRMIGASTRGARWLRDTIGI